MNNLDHITSDWRGLYGESWKGLITDEAFAHPAKFSRALIRKIYTHLLEDGLLKPGDTVLDPFGGVGLGGHDAMRLGLHWVGSELEAKFYGLGNGNIDLWRERYSWFPGSAVLLNGDSRMLREVLIVNNELGIMNADGAVSSPPFLQTSGGTNVAFVGPARGGNAAAGYGESEGQLSSMKDGGFNAAVSSPPFGEAQTGGGIGAAKQGKGDYKLTTRMPGSLYQVDEQWQTDGQLAGMKMDGFEGAVTSPPFEDTQGFHDKGFSDQWGPKQSRTTEPLGYGETEGNMGNQSGDSFWMAARQIVEQVYMLLAPGAPAVWVVKDYGRNKQIVPFCNQWRLLCEAVGFETLHIHRAWLVEDRGTQLDIFGNAHTKTVERKSFFRRLAEKKGSPRIDWEIVLCMRKPGGQGE